MTTGETVALAWELPHRPFYVEEELMQSYEENETLPLLNRNDEINSEPDQKIATPTHQTEQKVQDSYYQSQQKVQDSYYFNDRKKPTKAPSSSNNYYYGNNNYRKPVKSQNFERDYYYKGEKTHDFSQYGDNVRNKINEYSAKPYDPWRRSDWSDAIVV